MTPATQTPKEILAALPDDRKEAVQRLYEAIANNLPAGFAETVSSGYISFVVPHSLYPAGYHCNPKQPLPFVSIGSQKSHIALHHLGLYGDADLLAWFTGEYPKHSPTKLDMGKGCVRFKKPGQIPYALIGELMKKRTPQQWIAFYESQWKPAAKKA